MQLNRSIKLRANRVREIFTPIVIRAISFRGREPHRGFLQRWCHRDRGRKSYASFNNERANYQRYNASHQSVAAVTTCLSRRSIDLASPKTGACFFSSRVTRVRSFEKRQGEERNDGGTIGSAIPFHRTKKRSRHTYHRRDRESNLRASGSKPSRSPWSLVYLWDSRRHRARRVSVTRDTERHASQPFPVHAARFQMEVYRDTDDHSRHEDIPRFSVSRWEWDEKETERERMEGKDRRSRSCLPLGRASPLQAFRHFPLSPSRSHPFSARDRESERPGDDSILFRARVKFPRF